MVSGWTTNNKAAKINHTPTIKCIHQKRALAKRE
jgi:hypothetical protein